MAGASDETRAPRSVRGRVRSLWNWFGAVFGLVVLVGGSIMYITAEDAPAATPQVEAHDEPAMEQPGDAIASESHNEQDGTKASALDGADDGLEVIEIQMVEFGYAPGTIDIEAGVPVVLRFTNAGKLEHEAMVGDAHMQEEFAAAGDHDDEHAEGNHHGDLMAVRVAPGETKDLKVVIDEPGRWLMACHLVGHYEQGQVARINVSA